MRYRLAQPNVTANNGKHAEKLRSLATKSKNGLLREKKLKAAYFSKKKIVVSVPKSIKAAQFSDKKRRKVEIKTSKSSEQCNLA